jgi:hypothetical protein
MFWLTQQRSTFPPIINDGQTHGFGVPEPAVMSLGDYCGEHSLGLVKIKEEVSMYRNLERGTHFIESGAHNH